MTHSGNSLRLLYAEDDNALRMMITHILSAIGHDVTACSTGREAIEHLRAASYDVVLLDYLMPDLTGLNVLQWMNEQHVDTPVLILTGAGDEVVAVEAMKLGAYDYLRKEHVDIDHLPILVNGVYERYLFKQERARRELVERVSSTAVREFAETVGAVNDIVRHSLDEMAESITRCEQILAVAVDDDIRRILTSVTTELRQNYSVISFALGSVRGLASGLSEEIAAAPAPTSAPMPSVSVTAPEVL